ncbi:hypothetical protein DFQ28_007584, partial [Apophysomyces sp. BC1034]
CKFRDDEQKIYETSVKIIEKSWPAIDRLYTILYFDGVAYLESLVQINTHWIRSQYTEVKFPSTAREIIAFIAEFPADNEE